MSEKKAYRRGIEQVFILNSSIRYLHYLSECCFTPNLQVSLHEVIQFLLMMQLVLNAKRIRHCTLVKMYTTHYDLHIVRQFSHMIILDLSYYANAAGQMTGNKLLESLQGLKILR